MDTALTNWNVNAAVHSLLIDGIFTGVGSVLSFLPIIVVLFFFLSMLEDTGYMASVAFVMDKLLRRIGLSGRSIVPVSYTHLDVYKRQAQDALTLLQGVLIVADHGLFQAQKVEQLHGHAGVLGGNEIRRAERCRHTGRCV